MKEYNKVLLILAMNAKAAAKQNKLLEIAINTSDAMLSELCKASANMYRYYIKRGSSWIQQMISNPDYKEGMDPREITILDRSRPYNNSEWMVMQAKIDKQLKDYIESVTKCGKPAWQIEAERNGWAPICNAK